MRWLDGITDSMDSQSHSGSWWWIGKPGVLQSMGSQRVGHDWMTELNWTELKIMMVCLVPVSGCRNGERAEQTSFMVDRSKDLGVKVSRWWWHRQGRAVEASRGNTRLLVWPLDWMMVPFIMNRKNERGVSVGRRPKNCVADISENQLVDSEAV